MEYVPDRYKTYKMWKKFVEKKPELLEFFPNKYNTKKICKRVF